MLSVWGGVWAACSVRWRQPPPQPVRTAVPQLAREGQPSIRYRHHWGWRVCGVKGSDVYVWAVCVHVRGACWAAIWAALAAPPNLRAYLVLPSRPPSAPDPAVWI